MYALKLWNCSTFEQMPTALCHLEFSILDVTLAGGLFDGSKRKWCKTVYCSHIYLRVCILICRCSSYSYRKSLIKISCSHVQLEWWNARLPIDILNLERILVCLTSCAFQPVDTWWISFLFKWACQHCKCIFHFIICMSSMACRLQPNTHTHTHCER